MIFARLKVGFAAGLLIVTGFGCGEGAWTAIPPPDITGPDALGAVNSFVSTNGWSMGTNDGVLFGFGVDHWMPISGLPWTVYGRRSHPAITHNGVLYVVLDGWHHDWMGVAYNPHTNKMTVDGFIPLREHWYAWVQSGDEPRRLTKQYEGERLK